MGLFRMDAGPPGVAVFVGRHTAVSLYDSGEHRRSLTHFQSSMTSAQGPPGSDNALPPSPPVRIWERMQNDGLHKSSALVSRRPGERIDPVEFFIGVT